VVTTNPAGLPRSGHKARPPAAALLTAAQAAAEVYGTSERTFHNMRKAGLIPPPVVLGPRLLRWVRNELEAAVQSMPRQHEPQAEPAQLRRRHIDGMKQGAR
jgi:predicted DNA-binding transcriptional regulator AlpA